MFSRLETGKSKFGASHANAVGSVWGYVLASTWGVGNFFSEDGNDTTQPCHGEMLVRHNTTTDGDSLVEEEPVDCGLLGSIYPVFFSLSLGFNGTGTTGNFSWFLDSIVAFPCTDWTSPGS
jgi:hypothetical protein